MLDQYDTIYLSPHLDDVALSCGGQIADQTNAGETVLIVTVMAGNPPDAPLSEFAQLLHDRWELAADAVAARRAEDEAACAVLDADFVHWDVPDCIYRRHPDNEEPLYASQEALFGKIHPVESRGLVQSLSMRLSALPAHGRVVSPLAVGRHVDHQLVRAAAEACFDPALLFYEDYPYVRNESALTAVVPEGDPAWSATVMPLSDTAVAKRIEAIAAFSSQVGTFFNGRADLETQIRAEVGRRGGERLWRRREEA